MANFFTSSSIDEYRKQKLVLEADDEEDFDIKDEDEENNTEEQDDNNEPTDNEPVADNENFDIEDEPEETNDDNNEGEPNPTSEEPQNTEEDSPEQNDEDQNFDIEDQEEPQENTDDNQTDEEEPQSDSEDTSGGDEDNFDLPDDGDDQDGNEEGNVTESDDSLDDGDSSETTDPHQKLKDLEKDIFDNLSEDQKASKIKELKTLYISLYGNCDTLLEHIDDLPKEETTIKIYEFISNNINDLKQYIVDYINDTFDNRTYIENLTVFQKYLSVLDTINSLLEEIRDTKKDE